MKTSHKKILISLLLFLFIFCFIGLPFSNWWFNGDDFSGIALGKVMQTWKMFWRHFFEGNVNKYFYPSHHQQYTPYGETTTYPITFLSIYFRPIHCAYLAFSYWLFGFNAYAYYLANAFLHALNTTLLFNILSSFTHLSIALFFALLFSLHPQIGFRFGAPVNFQYYFEVLLIFLMIFALKRFLDKKKSFFLFLSLLFFLLALFTRETTIVMPMIICMGCWLYQKRFSWIFIPYALLAGFYLLIRHYQYPLSLVHSTAIPLTKAATLIATNCVNRFNEILVFIYDSFTLSWLPYGNKMLRLSVLSLLLTSIFILFIRNKNKKVLLFLVACYCLMVWPSLFGAYSPRYFYEASPFLFTFFAALIGKNQWKIPQLAKIFLTIAGSCIICLYAFFTYTNLRCRETKLFTMKQAFLELAHDQRITSGTRPLCFFAFPLDGFGTGIEQASWLFLTPPSNSVYYDPSTMLTQSDSNIIEHAGWYMRCAHYYTQNYLTITHSSQGIRFTSSNPRKINFLLQEEYLSLGTKTAHQTTIVNNQKVTTDFTLIFDQKYLRKKPLIITWNYENQRFVVHE